MKTITYNPETHVLVPREPSEEMCDAATADSCWENMNPPPSIAYRLMLAAAPQPEPNPNWCAGCSPDNCSGCGAGPVAEVVWFDPALRYGPEKAGKIIDGSIAFMESAPLGTKLHTTPQPDRTAELEAALKVARDALNDCEGALDECRDYPITYDTILETLAKINEVLHD